MSLSRYRAWDKENSRMVYPSADDVYFELTDDGINILDMSVEPFDDVFPHLDAVLMQSTGLKDKNGVEIFEGDVIGSQNKDRSNWYVSHHKIVWHDTGFVGKQICSSSFIGLEHWTRGENGYVVIGNIYENPELLEQANE